MEKRKEKRDEGGEGGDSGGTDRYRVPHLLILLVDQGWDDFDLGIPPSCPAAQPLLQNIHLPKQNRTDSGTSKSK